MYGTRRSSDAVGVRGRHGRRGLGLGDGCAVGVAAHPSGTATRAIEGGGARSDRRFGSGRINRHPPARGGGSS